MVFKFFKFCLILIPFSHLHLLLMENPCTWLRRHYGTMAFCCISHVEDIMHSLLSLLCHYSWCILPNLCSDSPICGSCPIIMSQFHSTHGSWVSLFPFQWENISDCVCPLLISHSFGIGKFEGRKPSWDRYSFCFYDKIPIKYNLNYTLRWMDIINMCYQSTVCIPVGVADSSHFKKFSWVLTLSEERLDLSYLTEGHWFQTCSFKATW